MASNTSAALVFTEFVTINMGQGDSAMILRVASTPLISGMIRSINIRSGGSSLQHFTASSPFHATHAISCSECERMPRRSASMAICISLTIAILTFTHPL